MPKQSELFIRSHQAIIEKIISDKCKEFVEKCDAKIKKKQAQSLTNSATVSVKIGK